MKEKGSSSEVFKVLKWQPAQQTRGLRGNCAQSAVTPLKDINVRFVALLMRRTVVGSFHCLALRVPTQDRVHGDGPQRDHHFWGSLWKSSSSHTSWGAGFLVTKYLLRIRNPPGWSSDPLQGGRGSETLRCAVRALFCGPHGSQVGPTSRRCLG